MKILFLSIFIFPLFVKAQNAPSISSKPTGTQVKNYVAWATLQTKTDYTKQVNILKDSIAKLRARIIPLEMINKVLLDSLNSMISKIRFPDDRDFYYEGNKMRVRKQ